MKRLALMLLALGMNVQAATLTLNEARAQGRVGETLSGYLAPVKQDPETLALVSCSQFPPAFPRRWRSATPARTDPADDF